MTPRPFAIILLTTVALSLVAGHSQAQDIRFLEPYQGTLSVAQQQRWEFIAQEGQLLSILAQAADSDLDPILAVYDRNGALLAQNDDYDYPNHRDALIEGFSAPYTGFYTLALTGYGDSAGAYEVQMMPGYGQMLLQERFEGGSEWELVGMDESEDSADAELSTRNGQLVLSQEGIQESAFALSAAPEAEVYYAEADFSSLTGAQGWQVGIVFQYNDPENYYHLALNNQGFWRLRLVEDGQETVLRDWGTHPAIVPGQAELRLAVLVNQHHYEVFYNGQFIGSEYDASLPSGALGVAVVTAASYGSEVTARLEQFLVTTPRSLSADGALPAQITVRTTSSTIRDLERRLAIPVGGSMAWTLEESFAQNVPAGVSRFALGGGSTYSAFVMGASIFWESNATTPLNGCGLVTHDAGSSRDDYLLSYIDNQGGYGIGYRQGEAFTHNVFNNALSIGQAPYEMVLVAQEGGLHAYINGFLVASLAHDAPAGEVGVAVVNFAQTNTECRFRDVWLWHWE